MASSSSDDEVFYDMDQEATMLFHARFIACTFGDLFIATKMEAGGGHFVDPTNGVWDVLATLQSTPTLFKSFTNFIIIECHKIWGLGIHYGVYHHLPCTIYKWDPYCFWEITKAKPWATPSKLCFFLKHDNVTKYGSFMWNWAKSLVCDDVLFISSCIYFALVDEIRWPTT